MAIGAIAAAAAVVLLLAGLGRFVHLGEAASTVFIGVSFGLILYGIIQMLYGRRRKPPAGDQAGG